MPEIPPPVIEIGIEDSIFTRKGMNWLQRLSKSRQESLDASRKIRERLKQENGRHQNELLEKAIQQEAYFLWESEGKPEGKRDHYWQKATERLKDERRQNDILKRVNTHSDNENEINENEIGDKVAAGTPIERGCETLGRNLKKLANLEFFGLVTNIIIMLSLGNYLFTEKQRRNAEILNAWQTITSADGISGNGGHRLALEFLNASPANQDYNYAGAHWRRRFPWICIPFTLICPAWASEKLDRIDVQSAYLEGIQLPNASLVGAELQESDLRAANLQGANLEAADLQEANLRYANLQGVNFQAANLQDTILRAANFQEADFRFANLQEADLRYADLQESILLATDLRQVRLSAVEQLDQALICNPALPDEFNNLDPYRDCDRLPQIMSDRDEISIEDAQEIVNEARQKSWD